MLLILANRSDYSARALADAWKKDAVLITPGDLSTPGWRLYEDRNGLRAVAGGRVIDAREISGVLTRMPSVGEQELFEIDSADRAFVAAEMTAFLLAWLTRLDCPVLNRPSPSCLCGPFWRHERWLTAARQAGLPAEPWRRDTRSPARPWEAPPSPHSVIVAGNRCFGDVDATLKSHAQKLAQTAGADLLSVEFSGAERNARFLRTHLWPDLRLPEVSAALLECFDALAPRRLEAVAS